jgi:hypothetical protein
MKLAKINLILGAILCSLSLSASDKSQLKFNSSKLPEISLNNEVVISCPQEGLWAVASEWENDWPSGWKYANPDSLVTSGEWTVAYGSIDFPNGSLLLRDSWRTQKDGLIQCVRRYEWTGNETLEKVTLSARLRMKGEEMMPLMPGILYYGNKMGEQINPNIIPVYNGKAGEFAIFEDHRYPMPFAMLEDAQQMRAAAVHVIPSPVRGAVLNDLWWSFGVEANDGFTDFVLYSGPIGYNGLRSHAKALQHRPMKYTDTYINLEPKQVVEKEFFVELYDIESKGSGFQQPVYTSLDLFKPYYVDIYPEFDEILKGKYTQTKLRWIEDGEAKGFNMYDNKLRKELVMGWCGQADSPGYSLQVLADKFNDPEILSMVQTSLDYLTTYPEKGKEGLFNVRYSFRDKKFSQGDHVSCGQAMYNFAKAIEAGRKNKKLDTTKWEDFLKKNAKAQAERILSPDWNPHSTAEAFYIAPLAICSKLFKDKQFKDAAIKAAKLFAERHVDMDPGCYWGGTLDATCEDKEGSWAAFQGFLELYERFGNKEYLDWAKHAMDVCLSYVVVWDIPLQASRLADHNFNSIGWTVVSPQNQHIDVYGVLFAPEVYKMGIHLKDERLTKLAKVMYRSCYQLVDAFGSQGEQLSQTNFAQQGDMSNVHKLRGKYSEGWTVFWITAHYLNAAARFVEIGVEP